jgi:hypothetical protein
MSREIIVWFHINRRKCVLIALVDHDFQFMADTVFGTLKLKQKDFWIKYYNKLLCLIVLL